MKEYVDNCVCRLRTEKGITQEELACSIGVTRQTIISIERGNYTPSVLLALRMAKFFKVPVETIFSIHHEA